MDENVVNLLAETAAETDRMSTGSKLLDRRRPTTGRGMTSAKSRSLRDIKAFEAFVGYGMVIMHEARVPFPKQYQHFSSSGIHQTQYEYNNSYYPAGSALDRSAAS
jgi:hypothetical protein